MLKFEQIRDLDDIPPNMTCLEVFSNGTITVRYSFDGLGGKKPAADGELGFANPLRWLHCRRGAYLHAGAKWNPRWGMLIPRIP
ncbi:hypothetical protein ACEUZ9_000240 [Paracoccus litorisediminis]|uniref:Uncharacterized protein n=1 Tax=Paracoccus litorisediminis TaxID=2006130 RepID=A0A844HGX2_9RHOB|nr:hypothetical protein [Paracoccus litorisediminis]MTH57614.1 hypothetical protein [Paracoccus litorisediminis]